jgi:hypothetical protein
VLRLLVAALALVFLVALGGLVTVRLRPALFMSLRNTIALAATPAPANRPAVAPVKIRLVSSSTSGAVYSVPVKAYALVLTIKRPCWTTISSPAGTSAACAATLLPSSSPESVEVHGSSSVMVAAQAVSIQINAGSKSIGLINAPIVGYSYTFVPDP